MLNNLKKMFEITLINKLLNEWYNLSTPLKKRVSIQTLTFTP